MPEINSWPGWECVSKIGAGSFGSVYKIKKEEYGTTYYAALKVISVPQNETEVRSAYAECMDEKSVTSYFQGIVEELVNECSLMYQLSGYTNIVAYQEHMVLPRENGFGWDLLIRMELLQSLQEYISVQGLTERRLIQLGCDVCRALELCEKKGIIHRDIKPDNIFVNSNGDFKLGDFGIARTLGGTLSSMSQKGTVSYMAPEVQRGERSYGALVDFYSLGIVLYRYLNEGRLPFYPMPPEIIRHSDSERALQRRMDGEALPMPKNGCEALKAAVLKATAFSPEHRFQTAAEFREALEHCEAEATDNLLLSAVPISDYRPWTVTGLAESGTGKTEGKTVGPDKNNSPNSEQGGENQDFRKRRPKKKLFAAIAAAVLALVVIAGGVFGYYWTSPARKAILYLENGDYGAAVELYNEKISGNSLQEKWADDIFAEYIRSDEKAYSSGAGSFDAIVAELDYYSRLNNEALAGSAQAYLDSIRTLESSKVSFQSAEELFQAGDYIAAIDQYLLVDASSEHYAAAQRKVVECESAYIADILESVSNPQTQADYLNCQNTVDAALAVFPEDASLLSRRRQLESGYQDLVRTQAMESANSLIAEGEYAEAVSAIKSALVDLPGDEQLQKTLETFKEKYKNDLLLRAEQTFAASGYEAAIQVLNEANAVIGSDSDINLKIKEYCTYAPVNISDLATFTGDGFVVEASLKDNLNQERSNVVRSKCSTNVYRIDGAYTRITGVWFLCFNARSTIGHTTLEIYGDGRLIFAKTLTAGIEPISLDLDISGVTELSVRVQGWYHETGIENFCLWK